jgi:hypothetical protein
VAAEYEWNHIDIGYEEIKSDIGALNGRQEFNSRTSWSTGTAGHPGNIEKVSKIKASCYEQEKIRTTVAPKETTDNKSDNDIFANWCDPVLQAATDTVPAHYLLDRSLNSTVLNLTASAAETVWNLRLSPKRMLLNNGAFLRSSRWKCDSQILKFTSADRNSKMVCGGIVENEDIQLGAMASPFFLILIYSIEVPAPNDLISLIDLNPLQVYGFTIGGNNYKGIANKISISPSDNKAQVYQLLALPASNFTDLINYIG